VRLRIAQFQSNIWIALLLSVSIVLAASVSTPTTGQAKNESFVVVTRDSLPVLKTPENSSPQKPIAYLVNGERLRLLGEKEGFYKVQLQDGTEGYSDKNFFKNEDGQNLYLNELKIMGFLDNPNPVYIFDMSDDNYKPIRMSKDFMFEREFMANFNKESFEWENEIYYYNGVDFKPEAVKPALFLPLKKK